MIKSWIKSRLMYTGSAATDLVRSEIGERRRADWPYVPPDEGDVLYNFAQRAQAADALEVGCATGSTAAYILAGLGDSGELTSIDFDQANHERAGEQLVRDLGFSDRHVLVEKNSDEALPALYAAGKRFGLVFLDGWKTFDHVWIDVYYSARMLEVGSMVVFDDARMPAVRKCISILERYYEFKRVDTYPQVGGWRQRLWHILTTRGFLPPYVALEKLIEVEESPAGKRYDYWARF